MPSAVEAGFGALSSSRLRSNQSLVSAREDDAAYWLSKMFDVAPTEFLLVALIALLVIGPKELPKAMRTVGKYVGKARGVARQFRAGFDEMVRESELAEMEKKWREENERIMREFPANEPPVADSPLPLRGGDGGGAASNAPSLDSPTPNPSPKGEGLQT